MCRSPSRVFGLIARRARAFCDITKGPESVFAMLMFSSGFRQHI